MVAACCAGCFGAGPIPPTAADAPIVFGVPIPSADVVCTASTYITSLAFGSDSGYAVLYPYGPETNDSSCNGTPSGPVDVVQFPIDGSFPAGRMVGNAGAASQQIPTPQIALGSNGPLVWFDMPSQPPLTEVVTLGGMPEVLPSNLNLGNLVGASGNFIATASGFQATDPMNPNYPCCEDNSSGQTPPGELTQYTVNGTMVTAMTPQTLSAVAIGELASSIATSSSAVFYIQPKQPGFGLEAITATGSAELATMSQQDLSMTGGIPVGLVADDAHVAWAFAQDAQQSPLASGCQIWATSDAPIAAGSGEIPPIFSSSNLSCMGLALDPDAVYFAIVDEESEPGCSGCTPELHGVGIGRVDFAMHMFSSIAFDIAAPSSGPRRIYTSPSDQDDVFVLDPLVVAKISKMAFSGRMDIAP